MEKSWRSRNTTTRHAGVVGLWGAPPQRPPGSSPNGNCRNGAILARSKTAPLPVPPSKRMKSPSNIMRQSSLTKLGSMINTAVNKRVGEFYLFSFFIFLLLRPPFFPFFSSIPRIINSPSLKMFVWWLGIVISVRAEIGVKQSGETNLPVTTFK